MSQAATTIAPQMRRVMQTGTTSVWQLTHNELFKLRKRRLVWGLLAVNVLFVVGGWLALMVNASGNAAAFQPGGTLAGADALARAIGQPMLLGRRGGELIATALGALAFGGEFDSGAIRLVLSRGVHRTRYLLAKYLALAVVCVALALAGIVASALLCNLLALAHQPAPSLLDLDGRTLAGLAGIAVGTLENYLFCLVLGAALGLLFRSAGLGVVLGCGWLIAEEIVAGLLIPVGSSPQATLGTQLASLLYTPNLNALFAHLLPASLAAALSPLDGASACRLTGAVCAPATPAHALVVPLAWAVVLAGTSAYLFVKRDVAR